MQVAFCMCVQCHPMVLKSHKKGEKLDKYSPKSSNKCSPAVPTVLSTSIFENGSYLSCDLFADGYLMVFTFEMVMWQFCRWLADGCFQRPSLLMASRWLFSETKVCWWLPDGSSATDFMDKFADGFPMASYLAIGKTSASWCLPDSQRVDIG